MFWKTKTIQGDTFDLLALSIYGSEKLAHVIQKANPEHMNVIFFDDGVELIIPETPVSALTVNVPNPPWARR